MVDEPEDAVVVVLGWKDQNQNKTTMENSWRRKECGLYALQRTLQDLQSQILNMFIIYDLSFRRLLSRSDRRKSLLTHPTPQENQTRCPLQTSDEQNRTKIGPIIQ